MVFWAACCDARIICNRTGKWLEASQSTHGQYEQSQKDQGVGRPTTHMSRQTFNGEEKAAHSSHFPFPLTSATETVKHEVTREASLPIPFASRQTWSQGPLTSWAKVFCGGFDTWCSPCIESLLLVRPYLHQKRSYQCLSTRWLRVFEDAGAKVMKTSMRQRNTILSEDVQNKHKDKFNYETH